MVCEICHHFCSLGEDEIGKCKVIKNENGTLVNIHHGKLSVLSADSIEKRPFFHFRPGQKYLSTGSVGCSLSCDYCVPGETLIRIKDGLKRIDQIVDGEEIFSWDSFSQQAVLTRVGHVFCRESEEVLELEVDGQTIRLTAEHPVYTRQRGWVKAKDLTVDDEVLCDKTYLEQDHFLQGI